MNGLGGHKSQFKDCFNNLNDYEFHFSEMNSAGVMHWLIIGLVNSLILVEREREREREIERERERER